RVGVALGAGLAIGPELILDTAIARIEGWAAVSRNGRLVWSRTISGGDVPLGLALAAIEPDHFERAGHRRPRDSHVHFFGARLCADIERPEVREGDEVVVELRGFGRELRTAVKIAEPAACVAVPL